MKKIIIKNNLNLNNLYSVLFLKYLLLFFILLIIFTSTFYINNCNAQWLQGLGNIEQEVTCFTAIGNNILAGTFGKGIYISKDNGSSWSKTQLNKFTIHDLFTFGKKVYAGSHEGGIYISTNNGDSWDRSSLVDETVWAITSLNSNIYAGSTGIYCSTDEGITWEKKGLEDRHISSFAIQGSNIIVGTWDKFIRDPGNLQNDTSGVYFSSNYGESWIYIGLKNCEITSLAVNNDFIYAGASAGVYFTSNFGTNWILSEIKEEKVKSLIIRNNVIFAGTKNYYYRSGGVYYTTDNGNHWIKNNEGYYIDVIINKLFIYDNVILAGTNYTVWHRVLSDLLK